MVWSKDRLWIGFGSAVPGIVLIFSAMCALSMLLPIYASAQHTYYISKTLGSDSNSTSQAQSKSTPWQHLPGTLTGCTTGCSTPSGWGCSSCKGPQGYGPVSGDRFILYGGDTWGHGDLGVEWDGNGTASCITTPNSTCEYIGVDQTWFKPVTGTCTISGSTCTWVSGLRAPYTGGLSAPCNTGYCGGDFGYLDSVTNNTVTLGGTSCTVSSTPAQGASNVISFSGCSPGTGTVSFSYSYWTRPIFNMGGAVGSNSNNVIYMWGNYVTFDNIEVTGFHTSGGGGGNIIQMFNTGQVAEHIYAHGWSHATSGDTDNGQVVGGGGTGTVHDCVFDGTDTTGDMMVGIISGMSDVYNNIFANLTNGFEAVGSNWHDNWVGPINQCYSGCHQNGIFLFGPNGANNNTMFLYNNVVTHIQLPGGGGGIWLTGNNPSSTGVGFGFNNVMYNNDSGFSLDLFGHNAQNYGTWYWFNNTEECGKDSALSTGPGSCANDGGGTNGLTGKIYFSNDHFIKGDTSAPVTCTYATCTFTTDLTQTLTTAQSQPTSPGYNDDGPPSLPIGNSYLAFSPLSSCTAGTCSTLEAGTNNESLCTQIAAIGTSDAATAAAACKLSTGYACAYNISNNTVSCPDTVANARPTSGAWDIGAYEFNGGDPPPAPPTNLTDVVN
jgi:hypothetical protein